MTATHPGAVAAGGLDVARLRHEFPVLRAVVNGRPLAYLDNGATSQKPRAVVEAESDFALLENANVHRGVHILSQRATARYDAVREQLRRFLNAAVADEIVFTSGTTAAINLVAQSYGRSVLRPGDEILLSEMEHHSNIVPWQLVAEAVGARIRAIPVTAAGELDLDRVPGLLTDRTRIVAITHVSNVLGTVNPVQEICREARRRGIVSVVDGSQAVPHRKVDITALGCDFYALTGHKMCGPTGTGALWGRREHLAAMPPFLGGGETTVDRRERWVGLDLRQRPVKGDAVDLVLQIGLVALGIGRGHEDSGVC